MVLGVDGAGVGPAPSVVNLTHRTACSSSLPQMPRVNKTKGGTAASPISEGPATAVGSPSGRRGRKGKRVARLLEVVNRFIHQQVSTLIDEYRGMRHRVWAMGVVGGSDVDPQSLRSEHVRAHAMEGQLFRRAVVDAAGRIGLPSTVVVEKRLFPEATVALGLEAAQIWEELTRMGRECGSPWRKDEKMAALVAWMALSSRLEEGGR